MKDRRIGIIGYGVIGKQIEYLISEDQVDQKVEFFYFDHLLYEKKE
jgi:predicted dinucleotide-utilizing enzyme